MKNKNTTEMINSSQNKQKNQNKKLRRSLRMSMRKVTLSVLGSPNQTEKDFGIFLQRTLQVTPFKTISTSVTK
jgi:hypothetical protein